MAKSPNYVHMISEAVLDRTACVASHFGGRDRSWGETLDRAARIAGGLQALGLLAGDRVALLSANSDDYMALYLAVPWAGGVLVPLNSRWSPAENGFAIEDCTPRFLFISDNFLEANATMLASHRDRLTIVALDDGRDDMPTISDLVLYEPAPQADRGGDDLLAIFYTGGTTGRSKGVMISHAGLTSNAAAMRDAGIGKQGCRMLIVAPLFHLAAAAALTVSMQSGGTAVIAPAFDPAATLDLIADAKVTDALLVPTMIQMLIDAPGFDASRLAGLDVLLYGASPMPETTLDRLMAAAPHIDFFQAYGMTELSCTATLLKPEYHRGDHRAAGRHRGAGKPLAGNEIRIVDAHGETCPTGEVGEILARGPGLMLGYWAQPELTADALRGGWMHTGDGGRLDDHGILYVCDRLKDMIVSGGENVYSAEVESAIAQHPAVLLSAVIGVPDAQWGERVHAVIVPRPGETLVADEITTHCRRLIAGYKCPRSVEFRSALPLSAAGKILKAELRKSYWEGHSRNVA